MDKKQQIVWKALKQLYTKTFALAEYLGDKRLDESEKDTELIEKILIEIENIKNKVIYIDNEVRKLK